MRPTVAPMPALPALPALAATVPAQARESTGGPFDLLLGLPAHPLLVHFAVVILPLAALGLVGLVLVPSWRVRYATLTLLGLFVGLGAAVLARQSGEALATHLGRPLEHARLGNVLPAAAFVLFLVGGYWLLMVRHDRPQTGFQRATGWVAAVLAIGVTVLTTVVGHTGAQAAWAGRIPAIRVAARATAAPATTSAAAALQAVSPTTQARGTYTLAQVQLHRTTSSCWTVINGGVYDVTQWIGEHPGGSGPILALCGTDGTAAFTGQHGGQGRPDNELATSQIGTLAP